MLQVAGVLKAFQGVTALDHVTMSVRTGEVHALVGGNGAGKSTLVKVLSGVHQPDAGELRLLGEPVRFAGPADAKRAGIATIHQETNLVPTMSVARNLLLGREPRGRLGLIDSAAVHARAAELLAAYGLEVDVRRPLGSLGEGACQIVALARAASADARLVIMDEPTTALDHAELEILFAAVARLREQGRSVVYVTHRMEELYGICDRVTVLREGRVVHTGPMAGLDRLRLVSLMLGRPFHPAAPAPQAGEPDVPADAPVLEARGLTRHHMLDGVSLEMRAGEVVGLGGLLGAGRSETARAIAGALPVDAGQVRVAGAPARRWSGAPMRKWSVRSAVRAGIGLVPENRRTEGIVPALSVRDNIALAALPRLSRAGIVSDTQVDSIVATFMRRLGIKAVSPRQPAGELSGGNQQKVLLARWLAMHPKVLLLDEPTRGVDVATKLEMQALLDELAVDGLAILLISSDVAELVANCDSVVVLRDGAITEQLTGPEVTEDRLLAALAKD
ncbi:sugar ABC transporter ATP-binding protein [Nonomuraea gerenzanensis]|uniref:Ribose ABC transport system, ATP-binding protein RbsA (TC 3.A.1.2.1) n=1 Tax=Nonomuraea gerenzanensis TaxID=93944 RepID=A0A1M4E997_9ACTN|nr:sugar ABC transporter ATP-binding protein [Nonomuraea gerenzanensis]SBO95390.1 Ribose ABC transport system, ATP-binding protein RbsA (TC 3.A.1.2.1) [Nonomuraea gerenzanensis]